MSVESIHETDLNYNSHNFLWRVTSKHLRPWNWKSFHKILNSPTNILEYNIRSCFRTERYKTPHHRMSH